MSDVVNESDVASERRETEPTFVIAVSQDVPWLHFAEKSLRRTDQVITASSLGQANEQVHSLNSARKLALISSEVVPSKIKEFQPLLDEGGFWKACVLKEPHDTHQRINDKHLKELGVEVLDRPENAKAFRRVLKILIG